MSGYIILTIISLIFLYAIILFGIKSWTNIVNFHANGVNQIKSLAWKETSTFFYFLIFCVELLCIVLCFTFIEAAMFIFYMSGMISTMALVFEKFDYLN